MKSDYSLQMLCEGSICRNLDSLKEKLNRQIESLENV